MAVDLNIPAAEDEEDGPFGGLPHGQDHPPFAGAHPMGDGDGAPAFDLNMAVPESEDEVDWFNAPAAAANFDLNFDLEEEEADEDADVYANDFHVIFAGEADAFNAAAEAASFDLNCDLEEEVLEGFSDEEHVEQGSHTQPVNVVIKRKNLSNKARQEIYQALLARSFNGKLKRRTTRIVANQFNVNRCYVQSIWRTAKQCLAAGVPVDVSCKRKKNCGRKKDVF
ncbi:unnamed protein product [Urochloa decumbens]|uniref:DUF7769 domain-containing protein n=1 Tax=Urochloa decumbens TaxID=240449 RepID=A0ABC8ZH32_9POAL